MSPLFLPLTPVDSTERQSCFSYKKKSLFIGFQRYRIVCMMIVIFLPVTVQNHSYNTSIFRVCDYLPNISLRW